MSDNGQERFEDMVGSYPPGSDTADEKGDRPQEESEKVKFIHGAENPEDIEEGRKAMFHGGKIDAPKAMDHHNWRRKQGGGGLVRRPHGHSRGYISKGPPWNFSRENALRQDTQEQIGDALEEPGVVAPVWVRGGTSAAANGAHRRSFIDRRGED